MLFSDHNHADSCQNSCDRNCGNNNGCIRCYGIVSALGYEVDTVDINVDLLAVAVLQTCLDGKSKVGGCSFGILIAVIGSTVAKEVIHAVCDIKQSPFAEGKL